MIEIRDLDSSEARRYVEALAAVLVDCVAGGASVNFMAGFEQAAAESFFRGVVESVARGERILMGAFLDGRLVGTVQVVLATPPNQPHRADIAKLLVHRSARGQHVARHLMEKVEAVSLAAGKTLLVLDTVAGGQAETLYARMGWNRVGAIPNYALYPDGRPCDTVIFWKDLTSK